LPVVLTTEPTEGDKLLQVRRVRYATSPPITGEDVVGDVQFNGEPFEAYPFFGKKAEDYVGAYWSEDVPDEKTTYLQARLMNGVWVLEDTATLDLAPTGVWYLSERVATNNLLIMGDEKIWDMNPRTVKPRGIRVTPVPNNFSLGMDGDQHVVYLLDDAEAASQAARRVPIVYKFAANTMELLATQVLPSAPKEFGGLHPMAVAGNIDVCWTLAYDSTENQPYPPNRGMLLYKRHPDMSLDTSFGTNGIQNIEEYFPFETNKKFVNMGGGTEVLWMVSNHYHRIYKFDVTGSLAQFISSHSTPSVTDSPDGSEGEPVGVSGNADWVWFVDKNVVVAGWPPSTVSLGKFYRLDARGIQHDEGFSLQNGRVRAMAEYGREMPIDIGASGPVVWGT
jgi:hypothetical protein